MTIEIQDSLLSYLYTKLTADSTLITACGGSVRLYPVWAKDDAVMPYIVNRIDMRSEDWNPDKKGTLLIDVWSSSKNATEVLTIKNRIMTLLNNHSFTTAETTESFIWLQTEGFVPESTHDIWHYNLQFNMKYTNDDEIGVSLKR